MTGIDDDRFLREAYPDPQERLAVRLAQDEAKAREYAVLGRVLGGSRSGTRLTEAQRAVTCARSERLQVRLRPGYVARLRELSEGDGYSVAEWIETWIEMAESELAEFRQRPPKRKR